MTDSPIQQIFSHPYRLRYISGAAVLLGLVLGLPAYDELNRVDAKKAELKEQITEVGLSINNLVPMRKKLAEVKRVSGETHQTVDDETALELREDVVRLIHSHHCRLLHVQLSEPQSMPWSKEADPLGASTVIDEEKTNYHLVRTKLSLTAEGSLKRIDQLVSDITELHELAVPTKLVLRETNDGDSLKIDIDLTLLDLSRQAG